METAEIAEYHHLSFGDYFTLLCRSDCNIDIRCILFYRMWLGY